MKEGWLREERWAPVTGIAVLLFGLAGLIVLEGPADRPEVDRAAGAFLEYFDQGSTVVLGAFLVLLSVVFFLWFLGSLREVLRGAEGEGGRLSTVAFGAGTATAALWSVLPGVSVLGALPRWLGWLSLALALWLLVPPLGSGAGTPENPAGWTALAAFDAVPIWTAITGMALMARGRARVTKPRPTERLASS